VQAQDDELPARRQHAAPAGGGRLGPRPRNDSPATGEMSCGTLRLEGPAMVLYAFGVEDTLELANGVR